MRRNVSDEVLLYLRKNILLGQIEEGSHLKELELSKKINVSRGPIRDAILKLEKEGLVDTPSNGRTIVNKFDKSDIWNLYDTRILLEKHAISQIKPKVLNENLDSLNSLVIQLEETYERGIKDVESDLAFHTLLIKMTKNKTLIQLWLTLNGLFQTLIEVSSSFNDLRQEEIIMEHKQIIEALNEGKVEKAQNIIEKHLKEVRTLLTKQL